MATIVYKQFAGEIPNTEPHLLPDDRAQYAKNCEFTGGALQPMKDGMFLQSMANNPVRGIYTEDGINFYTWATETQAFKSPTIGDTYGRVYHLTPSLGKFNVSTIAQATSNGPSPSANNIWKAGVPKPTAAPTLTLVNRSTLPDYPSCGAFIEFWYEYGGKQYQKAFVPITTVVPYTRFTFSPPAIVTGTPDNATQAIRLVFKDLSYSSAEVPEILSVTVKPGITSRSSAFPGGLEVSFDTAGTVNVTWGVVETRAYVYTCRNTWLEQGAPSPAALVSPTYMDDVQISVSAPDFTGYRPFNDFKIYRTYGTNASYIGVIVTGSGSTFLDSSNSKSVVGDLLASTDWTPPPDGMQGCALMPNGWFAGFVGNTLYMSEPYRPHAWPYSMTFSKNIRGIAVGQQSLVVTTADGVHVVTGAFPASAQSMRLAIPQPGIAQRSMTTVNGAVAYASNDGVVFVEGASATIDISQKLFTRAKWRERYSSMLSDASIAFAFHDGCLVASSASYPEGFTLRLDEGVGNLSRADAGYSAMFYLPVTDSLYYSIGPSVYSFKGSGSNKAMDWQGKDWIFPGHATFGAGYIRADGPTDIRLYADGALVYTGSQINGYFRLPSLPRALRWSVRLSGVYDVSEFGIAQSMMELKSV